MSKANNARRTLVAMASAFALIASAGAGSIAVAQDDGATGAVTRFADAIEAERFDELETLFCADFKGEAQRFDFTTALADEAPDGLEASMVTDALTFEFDPFSVTVVEESGDSATLGVDGVLTLDFDPDGAGALVGYFIETLVGDDVPDAVIEEAVTSEALAALGESFAVQTQDLSTDSLQVVREGDGVWRICSSLDDLAEDTADDMSDAVEDIGEDVQEVGEDVSDAVEDVTEGVRESMVEVLNPSAGIRGALDDALDRIGDNLELAAEQVGEAIEEIDEAIDEVSEEAEEVADDIGDIVEDEDE